MMRKIAACLSVLAIGTSACADTVDALPGWKQDSVQEAWPAFLKTCAKLGTIAPWVRVCNLSAEVDGKDAKQIRQFFEINFTSKLLSAPDGSAEALITGYYEPVLAGSRKADAVYRFPLYSLPTDLIKGVPYKTRKEVDSGEVAIPATVIAYLKDDLDRYLAHVQGSCKVDLIDGSRIFAVYAGKNSHQYASIGKILVARGEIPAEKISMQAIRAWASANPDRVNELLWSNPSYTFFLEREATADGPPGAMNLDGGLTPQRSAAIDPDRVPFGYPIWMDTTLPDSSEFYQRLLMSQDKGAAIKGLRVDVFFGSGHEAGELAGKMKQAGRVWVLVPIAEPNADSLASSSLK